MRSLFAVMALLAVACSSPTPGGSWHRPAGPLVISNARLVDPRTGAIRSGMIVIIEGDQILGVEEQAGVIPPPGAEIIDAAGRLLLPDGDAHGTIEEGKLANLIIVDDDRSVVVTIRRGDVQRRNGS